jgi:hypothetical protein
MVQQVWVKSSFAGVSTFIPVTIVETVDGASEIELPWSEKGEPAGPLRRGMQTAVPSSTLVVSQEL